MVREGLRNVAAGASPMRPQARHRPGRRGRVRPAARDRPRGRRQGRHRPRRQRSRAQDPAIGELIAEAFDKVGKDGVITVEEAHTMGLELEFTEGMQFDKGYISPYMVTDPERMEAVLEDAYILINQGKISAVADLLPLLEKVVQGRQAAADRGRGRRRRGALDPGRQQDPRHVHLGRRQGARLRRPPQGHARGPRRAHRRPGRRRGGRPQARPGRPRGARHRPPRRGHQGRHHDHRRRRRRATRSRPGSARSRPRSRTPTRTGTARSSRSGWPSSPAASASSGSARPPRSSSRSASTASRTPSRRPARRSRRASSPVAARRSCTPIAVLDDLGLTGDEATGANIVRRAADEPLRWIAENAGEEGYVVVNQGPRARRRATATTPRPASTATWSPRASSTRSR